MLKYCLKSDIMYISSNSLKEEERYLTKVKTITKEKQEIFESKNMYKVLLYEQMFDIILVILLDIYKYLVTQWKYGNSSRNA